MASDALFVTLDPLVRQVRLPDRRELLVSDTVGFIDRLPHALVAAFRATLEEVAGADLLLHVIDASNPDRDRQMDGGSQRARRSRRGRGARRSTCSTSRSAGRRASARGCRRSTRARCAMSALTGEGRDELVAALEARLALDTSAITLDVRRPASETAQRIAQLYRVGRMRRHVSADGHVSIEADVPRRVLEHFVDREVRAS